MNIDRRTWAAAMLGMAAAPGLAQQREGRRVLHAAFEAAETGFDPAAISDLYSAIVTAHIFEAPYTYDPLAMPVKPKPLTAAGMPQVSPDHRVWTVRLQPGIFFADDPAFKGRPRELVAQDYVYSIKRFFDPATKSPVYSQMHEEGIVGLDALRQKALAERKPFDYDAPVEGLKALDRYTLQFRLSAPRPRFLYTLCDSSNVGAMAREVVELYGDDISGHPVGTGPYRLKHWRRSSHIVLERNPGFRDMRYDAEPAPDDAIGQAWLARLKGRRLPLNDGVEISVIEEGQPRWLSFVTGQVDFLRVPPEFTDFAAPGGKLAPNLARKGVTLRRYVNPDRTMSWFNMEDPVVGGYTPEKVALRRAISLAYDIDREVRIVRRGAAVAAQAPMPPGTYGHDPAFRSENSEHDPMRAKALLDMYGYVDRDGDGWRELPDGRPLVLQMATQTSYIERQFDETWQKSLAAVGLRIRFNTAQWPENLKAARAGKLQMWSLAGSATQPDGQPSMEDMYGPSIGEGNLSRFKLPAYDEIYRRMLTLPDGPERMALFLAASKLVVAYMPTKFHVHRVYTDVTQPWITGYRWPLFRREGWQYVDIDPDLRERMTR
ncbi:ABC transporter substrate-binding protein [Piscinibacter sp. XHJ-5]|uniref:ABC transporter substrate-binding protein n=1 Tax=Piscinibacter sp. XHJ-5 TaxID=3037797 RepID=UPI0024529F94|nr:ABC transporter substrate-binding protein [Piscinibacter sp. XHJ-5]